jgi:hypothetical protein
VSPVKMGLSYSQEKQESSSGFRTLRNQQIDDIFPAPGALVRFTLPCRARTGSFRAWRIFKSVKLCLT